jgi:peptidoglycan-associated lipoprotein
MNTPMHISPIRFILAASLALGLAACAKKVKEEAPVSDATPPPTSTPASDDGKYGPEDLETVPCLRQRVVYFDFDRSDIKSEAAEILACHGKYLRDRPSALITLEGHADERGSREYNLGLGERRGNAVSGALQANGGSAGQLNVVSYGEERPVAEGHDESSWSQNRRVEIVYTAK